MKILIAIHQNHQSFTLCATQYIHTTVYYSNRTLSLTLAMYMIAVFGGECCECAKNVTNENTGQYDNHKLSKPQKALQSKNIGM